MKTLLERYNEGSEFAPKERDAQRLKMPGSSPENSLHGQDANNPMKFTSGVEIDVDAPGYSISGKNKPTMRYTIPGDSLALNLPPKTRLSVYEGNTNNNNLYTKKNIYDGNAIRNSEANQVG